MLDRATSVVVSVSGGLDSTEAARRARERFPRLPMTLLHLYLHEALPAEDQITYLARSLGNCRPISIQARYTLDGTTTSSGCYGTHLAGYHVVRDGDTFYDPIPEREDLFQQDERPVAERRGEPLTSLLDFAWTARRGQPPTKKLRYCTDYFKARPCDRWLRRNAAMLGRYPVLVTGERHSESDTRADLPELSWRFGKDGQPRKGWDVLWWRPILPLPFHDVARNALTLGEGVVHPGYFLQGATIESMTDPLQDERGRPRLSCVVCIFTSQRHLQLALGGPYAHIVRPYVEKHKLFERLSGKTWQQRGPLHVTGA